MAGHLHVCHQGFAQQMKMKMEMKFISKPSIRLEHVKSGTNPLSVFSDCEARPIGEWYRELGVAIVVMEQLCIPLLSVKDLWRRKVCSNMLSVG